ncbi:MAG TPA: tetratricopeptide repeat protein [Gaiellaceae bacterium]|nr:tetratricopeptide repeat protein [Gaiellaceae bacterium]
MSRAARTHTSTRTAPSAAIRLGDRLRQLRVAAGMTQAELAGDRFSKEYLSQIERGKTRPTEETIEWLATRLDVDPLFLANGVSTDQRDRVEAGLARAEALTNSDGYLEAVEMYADLRTAVAATGLPELEVRLIAGEAKALIRKGDVRVALERLTRAREVSESDSVSDAERADVLFKLGVCRFMLSSVSTALGLLNQALELAERSGLPCDLLISDILHWRSRCYRHQRDFEAAREDVERALELAEAAGDPRTMAHLYFQASLIAERKGHWVLSRSYAEKAKALYEEIADRANTGRLLNTLGALSFQLGKPEEAVRHLKDAFATALEVGAEADAAQAVSSLAQAHLRMGNLDLAEEQARHALKLLDGRDDFLDEIGNAQLVLGRALLEQGRLEQAAEVFDAAETTLQQFSSASHLAAAWVAKGDLATRQGDDRAAAYLYRRAAEALQDFRW